jgi:uncharacterized protein YdeI (YjbR/CyaY-like superfamily)
MKPVFFSDQLKFRKWLEKNHQTKTELLVGFYKVGTGKASMTWPESVDQAICFGWIDSIRRTVDEESYSIRFTPRKRTSIWSAVNIKKVERLMEQKLMFPAGIESFSYRKDERSKIYSFETDTKKLSADLEKKFKAGKKAWHFFETQPPYYRKMATHWIMSAKQETTRLSRLEKIILKCEMGKRLWDK